MIQDPASPSTGEALKSVDSLVAMPSANNATSRRIEQWLEQFCLRDEIIATLRLHKVAPFLPFQEKILSGMLTGKDVLGTGTFGTGKSLSYLIGALQSLQLSRTFVHTVIIVGTPESAGLLHSELSLFTSQMTGLNVLISTESTTLQDDILRVKFYPPHILIGTPARVVALSRASGLAFAAKPVLILDEVEKLSDRETRSQVEYFIATVPRPRQTLLFSGFLTHQVLEFSSSHQNSPLTVGLPQTIPKHLYTPPVVSLEAVTAATAAASKGTVCAANAKTAAAKALQQASLSRAKVSHETLALLKKMEANENKQL